MSKYIKLRYDVLDDDYMYYCIVSFETDDDIIEFRKLFEEHELHKYIKLAKTNNGMWIRPYLDASCDSKSKLKPNNVANREEFIYLLNDILKCISYAWHKTTTDWWEYRNKFHNDNFIVSMESIYDNDEFDKNIYKIKKYNAEYISYNSTKYMFKSIFETNVINGVVASDDVFTNIPDGKGIMVVMSRAENEYYSKKYSYNVVARYINRNEEYNLELSETEEEEEEEKEMKN